ncbi:Uncharacterized protein CLAVI_000268 [Candidatus Clavichlamydia salmonicola]|uniref:hypothetical protein n=1 Tax=Candidatus Clavichlamydia salmonicola TaxID=469812 RepID=UPI001891B08C|nr:hypothetical protein [Candidatus Clavichlamydia salmonicola]MBF5050654.1 Uncharacterized protein [Candidatus Clavichlamydia salmonicola]
MKKLLISAFAIGCLFTDISCSAQENDIVLDQSIIKKEEVASDKKQCNATPENVKRWTDCLRSNGFAFSNKKTGVFSISGDVRTRWIGSNEKIVTNSVTPPTNTSFDMYRFGTEFNCNINYELDRTWVSTRTRWAAVAGTDSRTSMLDKAVVGYALFEKAEIKEKAYFEVGRVSLGSVFESGVQFDGYFDGLRVAYQRAMPASTPGYMMIHGGPFVINSQESQYGWVVEAGIGGVKGFKAKYSFIDWKTFTTRNASNVTVKYNYQVSQIIGGYENTISKYQIPYGIVVGGLVNPAAKATATTLNKKLNTGFYISGSLGKLQKAGDLSLALQYERVGALAIPESDVSGIGHGNAQRFFFANAIAQGYEPALANGATNYKGISLNLGCAISKTLALRGVYQYSTPLNEGLGQTFTFSRVQMLLASSF